MTVTTVRSIVRCSPFVRSFVRLFAVRSFVRSFVRLSFAATVVVVVWDTTDDAATVHGTEDFGSLAHKCVAAMCRAAEWRASDVGIEVGSHARANFVRQRKLQREVDPLARTQHMALARAITVWPNDCRFNA